MYKKVVLVFLCACLLNFIASAQKVDFCKAGKDSMSARFARKELAAFVRSKTNPNLYNFIIIDKNHYEKRAVRITPKTDSMSESQKMVLQLQKRNDKTQPLDSSADFKRCFNAAFQPKLDSAFKLDFFRKADSIMEAYDKQGKGYKNAEFQGGPGAMQKFLDKNITLPKDAKENDSDKLVRIYCSFSIDEKGDISDVKLLKSNCKECEAVVLEGISKMPAFIPATEAGKAKKINYILPYSKNLGKPLPPKSRPVMPPQKGKQ